MILGVVLGEFILRISLGLESLWKTIFEPRKSKIKVIRKNLWLCMADKNGQTWKVANILLEYQRLHKWHCRFSCWAGLQF